MFFVFEREEKSSKILQAESRQPGSHYFFGLEVLRAFYSPGMDYETATLVGPPPSNGPGWG